MLVTGAGGFIGGHLAVALNRAGARVRAFCRYNSRGEKGTLDWFAPADVDGVEAVLGDLRDPESVASAARATDTIFHLGALIAIPYSFTNPRDYLATNVIGTLNVAQAALAAGTKTLVHLSTSEVYGEVATYPIREDHPLDPRSPYAASKVAADALVHSFHASFGLPVVLARPFNTFGPHQSARAIIPTIVAQALSSSTIRLGRLDPRRDLTYVSDTVEGLMALARSPDATGEIVQLGSGRDVSVAELVELIGARLGHELEIEHDPERVRPGMSEVPRLLCDHSRATALSGWTPKVDLAAGLERTIAWIEANRSRFRAREYAK